MSLLYPEFLWALALNIIPIIIHLFNLQKHETLYFSDLTLLKSIEQETKKKSQLKNILLLLLRMLFISSLVIAFCYPYNSKEETLKVDGEQIIGIYLDNSLSMQRIEQQQTLLDIALDDAMKIIENQDVKTKYIVTTNNKNNNKLYPLNKNEVTSLLSTVKSEPFSLRIDEIIAIQKEQTKNQFVKTFWFTDLQKKDFTYNETITDTVLDVHLLHYESDRNDNISIDSIWFTEKTRKINNEEELNVQITNYTDKSIEFQTKLFINKNEVINQSLNLLNAFETKTIQFHYLVKNNGTKNGLIKITDAPNNDQVFDDQYYFSYKIDDQYKVVYFSETNPNIKAFETLYGSVEKTDFIPVNITNGVTTNELFADLVIFDEISEYNEDLINLITSSKERSSNIVVVANSESNNKKINGLIKEFQLNVKSLDTNQSLLDYPSINKRFFNTVFSNHEKNIDLPYFKAHYEIGSASPFQTLISYENEQPFLIKKEMNNRKLFLFTGALNTKNSNFTQHALFVPTFLKIKEDCSNDYVSQYKIDDLPGIPLSKLYQQNGQLKVLDHPEKPNFSFLPFLENHNGRSLLYCKNQIFSDGHFFVQNNDSIVKSFATNYNREESVPDFFSKAAFNTHLKNYNNDSYFKYWTKSEIDQHLEMNGNKSAQYWVLFIILALIFIILEIVLIKLTS